MSCRCAGNVYSIVHIKYVFMYLLYGPHTWSIFRDYQWQSFNRKIINIKFKCNRNMLNIPKVNILFNKVKLTDKLCAKLIFYVVDISWKQIECYIANRSFVVVPYWGFVNSVCTYLDTVLIITTWVVFLLDFCGYCHFCTYILSITLFKNVYIEVGIKHP